MYNEYFFGFKSLIINEIIPHSEGTEFDDHGGL